MLSRLLCVLSAGLLILASASPSSAASEPRRRALLIAVSDYDLLPPRPEAATAGAYDLAGPRFDITLMVQAARRLSVADEAITVLTNGQDAAALGRRIDAAPTRAAILAALDRLVAETRAGEDEQVLIYFSGHGSQQPDADGDEVDGLDEFLLPSDIGRWDNGSASVANAITDDELGRYVDALRAKGAFVWVIIDACHSGTALRGGPVTPGSDVEIKRVSQEFLDIPSRPVSTLQPGPSTHPAPSGSVDGLSAAGGVAAFYGATAEEAAIARPMTRSDGSRTPSVGILTYAISEALQSGRAHSYRDLALRVRAVFDEQGSRAPQPAFEGDFSRSILGFDQLPARRWAAARTGARITIMGGSLDDLSEGAVLAIRPEQGLQAAPALHVRIDEVTADRAIATPVAFAGAPAGLATAMSDRTAYSADLVAPGVALVMRVGLPPADPVGAANALNWRLAIEQLSALGGAGRGVSLDLVARAQPADLYLVPDGDRLWLSDRNEPAESARERRLPGLDAAKGLSPSALADSLEGRLRAAARSRNLLRIASQLENGPIARMVEVSVMIDRVSQRLGLRAPQACPVLQRPFQAPPDAAALTALEATGPVVLRHCDVVYVTITNRGDQPVDMTPFYFDREFNISYLESGERDGVRLPPSASRTFPIRIVTSDIRTGAPHPLGLEQLAIFLVPRTSDQVELASYAYLSQRSAPPTRAAEAETSLDRLLDAAAFNVVGQRAGSSLTGDAAAVRFSWVVGE